MLWENITLRKYSAESCQSEDQNNVTETRVFPKKSFWLVSKT